jgi:hypothetical protein
MKIEKLTPGQIVYDVRRQNMGNTTISTVAVFSVEIVSVDAEEGVVVASWNSNPPQRFYRQTWSKWRAKKPVTVPTGFFGQRRLQTAEERKQAKQKEQQQ